MKDEGKISHTKRDATGSITFVKKQKEDPGLVQLANWHKNQASGTKKNSPEYKKVDQRKCCGRR